MSSDTFESKWYCAIDANEQVLNKSLLKLYREKRGRWFSWHESDTDEPNTIQGQLMSMLVTDMSYRVFRAESETQMTGNGFAIPLVTHLANEAYVLSQIMAIRRLMDKNGTVLSLTRLINEIEQCRHTITRENYVSYDGTPYDPNSWPASEESLLQHRIYGLESPALSRYFHSAKRHKTFDLLARIGDGQRSRTDLISQEVVSTLRKWIKESDADAFVTISHKYFAHAAQASTIGEPLRDVKLNEIEVVQKALVRTTRAVFDLILCSESFADTVPMLPLGFFGMVWSNTELIASTARMQKHWNELAESRNAWVLGIKDALL